MVELLGFIAYLSDQCPVHCGQVYVTAKIISIRIQRNTLTSHLSIYIFFCFQWEMFIRAAFRKFSEQQSNPNIKEILHEALQTWKNAVRIKRSWKEANAYTTPE